MSLILAGARRKILPQSKKGFKVQTLFMNGEAGGVYDPSDLTAEKVAWRRNLLTWSEDFTNAAWTKTRSSITPNAGTSWDGTATASKLVEDSSASLSHVMNQDVTVVAGTSYTFTKYAKAAERTWVFLNLIQVGIQSNRTWFNLGVGTVGTSDAGNSATIENVGGGWYRLVVSRTMAAAQTSVRAEIGLATGDGVITYTGDGTSGVLIDSSQLERGSTATAYQRITDFTSDFLAAFPTHGLYQDAAGTTPVTALGQPVGLVIDSKTGGLANVGAELATNGDFSGGTTGWTAGPSTTLSVVSGRMRFQSSTTDGAYFGQTLSVVAGKTYRLTFANFTDGGAVPARLYIGTSLGSGFAQTPNSFGEYQAFWTAPTTGVYWFWPYGSSGGSPNTYSICDNISVREVPGVHAIQATNSSRPLLDGRVNLFVSSDEVGTGAGWTIVSGTVTANAAVAPDGTTTADAYTPSAVSASQQISQVGTGVASSYIQSIAAKANGYSFIQMNNAGNTDFVNFDLSTGTVGTVSGVTASIEPLGNGWYRCTTVYAPLTPNINFRFQVVPSASATRAQAFTGNGTSGVLFWRADFRLAADAAYPPQRVTTATDYADVGVPRSFLFDGFDDSLYTASNMDFATVTSDGLARRNLLTNPLQFDVTASWTLANPGTLTANTDVAPDGTTTASTVTDNITGNFTAIRQTVTVANNSQQYVGSAFLKKTTGATTFPGLVLLFSGGTGKSAALALNTNTGIATARTGEVPDTIAVTDAGAYWRVQWTVTNNASGNTSLRIEIVPAVNTDAGATWSATTTGSTVAWGAQIETGTTATTFQNIGTDKVTVLAGVRKLSDAARGMLTETQGSPSNRVAIEAPSAAATADFMVQAGGSLLVSAASPATFPAPTTRVISALNDIPGDLLVLRINGTQVASNTANQGTGNNANAVVNIGRRDNTTLPFNGKAYQLIVRGALTDAATLAQAERYVAKKTGVTI